MSRPFEGHPVLRRQPGGRPTGAAGGGKEQCLDRLCRAAGDGGVRQCIVLRPQRCHLGLGLDSWVALVIYVLRVGLVVSG